MQYAACTGHKLYQDEESLLISSIDSIDIGPIFDDVEWFDIMASQQQFLDIFLTYQ